MDIDHSISKINVLINTKRYSDAENIAKELIANEPDNPNFLFILAQIHFRTGRYDSANNIVDNAIKFAPDNPEFYYLKSNILFILKELYEADYFIKAAIQINPLKSKYYVVRANIRIMQELYELALAEAVKALKLDPENIQALTAHSRATQKLNLPAFDTNIKKALQQDPANSYTHTSYGWTLLETGKHKKSLEHFKQALNYDPTSKLAKSGLVEALMAENILFRILHKTSDKINRLLQQNRIIVHIALYILLFLIFTNKENYSITAYVYSCFIVLMSILFAPVFLQPLGNLSLLFKGYGSILSTNDKPIAILIGISIAISLFGIVMLLFNNDNNTYRALSLFGLIMTFPIKEAFLAEKQTYLLISFIILITILGTVGIYNTYTSNVLINIYSIAFIITYLIFLFQLLRHKKMPKS